MVWSRLKGLLGFRSKRANPSLESLPDDLVHAVFADPAGQDLLRKVMADNGLQGEPADLPPHVQRTIVEMLMAQGVIQIGAQDQGTFDGPYSYVDQLLNAITATQSATDPESKISAWTTVLDLEPWVDPWPTEEPSREAFRSEALVNRATAYSNRIRGVRADNLEAAIAGYDAALEVLTRETFPQEWALIQMNRAAAYSDRIRGVRADNLEEAIAGFNAALEVLTRDAFPVDWARTQMNRATAYPDRISGVRADNVEEAIAGHDAALEVYTREAFPEDWAKTQMNRANAYQDRIRGVRADNVEEAIAGYDAALEVRTREAFPKDWALTQMNRAYAYKDRIRGVRADNVEEAIAGYDAALEVYTRDAFPQDWASTQMGRAYAYKNRIRGVRADNLEEAIAGSDAALEVYTRDAFPQDWAKTQGNRANAYLRRISGVRADNLEEAIAGHDAALEVLTRDAFPQDWALTQMNRALAYMDRIRGVRADNLEEAISGYDAALEVWSLEADPNMHLRAARLFGAALSAAQRWDEALDAFGKARRAADLLIGTGLDAAETERVLEEVQALGPAMALAASSLGEPTAALEHLDAGRARQLVLGLQRNAAREALAPEDQASFDARLSALRAAQAELAAATPQTRSAALAAVASARGPFEEILTQGRELAAAGEPSLDQRLAALSRDGMTLAAPVFTDEGAILLLAAPGASVEAVDVPDRTLKTLTDVVRGDDSWLAGYVANYRDDHQGFVETLSGIGDKLWDLIGRDLIAALEARGIAPGARLALLPQGALGLLPIGLTRHPETGELLVDRYELSLAPNLAALDDAPEPASLSLAAIVNPTEDLRYTPLEAALVAQLFPGGAVERREGSEATRGAVLELLKDKSHWHFACHGAFDWGDPRRSGLKLANGEALTLGDLMSAQHLTPPRLVALSACETGLTEINRNPEEFLGLPAGFLERGARGVLATLWPVNDASTALLVHRFFELHIREGQRPAAALKAAQAWLRHLTNKDLPALTQDLQASLATARLAPDMPGQGQEPSQDDPDYKPFADPYHWAGFAIYGR
ncbi:MAG: CHAT domain-containing tetratricopeptide repeat protein [Pseudomonadota bacterium]